MAAGDANNPAHLDRQWDEFFLGVEATSGRGDPELAAVMRQLRTLAIRPTPDPAFVRRLQSELVASDAFRPAIPQCINGRHEERRELVGARHAVPLGGRHEGTACRAPTAKNAAAPAGGGWKLDIAGPWLQRLEIAALLLVVAVLAGYLAVAERGRRAAIRPQVAGIELPPVTMRTIPVRLRIDAIGVDAPVERREPDVESPLLPVASEPWVVAWRADSAAPGAGGNVVLEGHLDYWSTGPAVFWDLEELTVGDRVEVIGANRAVFSYWVEWLRQYPLDASEEGEREILGPTPSESLTLITDAGVFDTTTNAYLDVLVVRARFDSVSSLPIVAVPGAGECRGEPRTIEELDAAADAALIRAGADQDTTNDVAFMDTSASSEITAAVIAAERRLVACLNANDALRTYALFTDDGLVRLMDFASGGSDPAFSQYTWDPDFSEFALPATPVPESERFALLAVEDVSLLDDGRVMATVTIGAGSSGMFGVPTGEPFVHVFERGERYLIDYFFVPGPGTPSP